jgi:hypothetical protein
MSAGNRDRALRSSSRLVDLMASRPALIVSLPRNDAELAKAAAAGGADALKVHINVHHDASGTHFGTLAEERRALEEIVSGVSIPIGIVPGAATMASREDLESLREMGLDFFDAFAHHMPAWMLSFVGMGRVAAIDGSYDPKDLPALEAAGAQAFEAAIVAHSEYGTPVTVRDIARYRQICAATSKPVIVPSQRKIESSDVPALVQKAGVRAVMIGAIVTGGDAVSIERATAVFRAALDGGD